MFERFGDRGEVCGKVGGAFCPSGSGWGQAARVAVGAGGGSDLTNDPTPTIAGTTDAPVGSAVLVTVDGQTLATTVQAGGTWSVTAAGVADGTFTVVAFVTDLVGNTAAAPQLLTVDTVAPVVMITGGGSVLTNDATPTIAGVSDAAVGSSVTVTVAGQTLITTVQTGGVWSVSAAALANGTFAVTV